MSPLGQTHLQEINVIAEALNKSECRKLIYLCESLETDCSAEFVKETLQCKIESHENAPLFLKELMSHLGRYDILRKVYKVGRAEIDQQLQTNGKVLPTFRVLMVNISEDMLKRDVEGIKFLLSNELPREKMRTSKCFLDVLVELEKLDYVSPDRVNIVKKCLLDIGRVDLVKKVDAYKVSVETSAEPLSSRKSCQAAEIAQRQPRPFVENSAARSSQQQSCRAANFNARQPKLIAAKVNVPLPVIREPVSGSSLEQYKFTTNPRGVCVIIDCVGNDGEMLEQTFKALHFTVFYHRLLTADLIDSSLRGIIRQMNNYRVDAFVCCIISRGTTHHLLGTDLCGRGVNLDSIRSRFLGDACPMLVGKPKLFFIQRYSIQELNSFNRMDNQDDYLETDGFVGQSASSIIPTDADIFWSHCWTDEYQLHQGHHHSVYLKALTDALHKAQKRKTNLVDVHMEVNGAIFEHNERNPGADYSIDVKHTLRKNLYLQ